MIATLALAALVAAAPAQGTAPHVIGYWDGTPERAAAMRSAVVDQLREPESAFFRDVTVRKVRGAGERDAHIVCGKVQGRNGYGGLGQPMAFFVTDRVAILPDPGPGEDAARLRSIGADVWSDFCVTDSDAVRSLDWNE